MSWNIVLLQMLHAWAGSNNFFAEMAVFGARPFSWIVIGASVLFMMTHSHHEGAGTLRTVFARYLRDRVRFVNRLRELGVLTLTVLATWLVVVLLKNAIEMPRPFLGHSITPLFMYGKYDSFPSGHAALFMALAVAIGLYHRRAGLVFGVCAVVIGLARIAVGIHYPIDIFVGWLLGGVLAWGIHTALTSRRLKNRQL